MPGNSESDAWQQLKDELQGNGFHDHVISRAIGAPLSYAKEMLPRVTRLVSETAKDRPDHLQIDPLWSFRPFGDHQFQAHNALFEGLAKSLEAVAKTSPGELDRLLEPILNSPCEPLAFLVLRAWTAGQETYADHLADYLAQDPRRLKIGYQTGGSGSFVNYVSTEAVKAASASCSTERLSALEDAILTLTDDWEAQNPPIRGYTQLELLRAFNSKHLSASALARLQELQRKFPDARHEEPQAIRGGVVGSPIGEDAQAKMSDQHWLKAMQKYSGADHHPHRHISNSGGEYQLATSLMTQAEKDPVRFAALTEQMPDDFPASYFDAILRGIAGSLDQKKASTAPKISAEQLESLVRRIHALPNHPCGSAIAWLFEKGWWVSWQEDSIEVLTWYAIDDPDPKDDFEKESAVADIGTSIESGVPEHRTDPYTAGINSTRGRAAEAIGRLLFERPQLFARVQETVHFLARDRSISVRSCAIVPLLASLNIDYQKAVAWFNECVAADPILLGTPHARRFVHYAAYRDFDTIWSVIERMLASEDPDVVWAAALEVCLVGLDLEVCALKADRVEKGTPRMREAAATVYAQNVAHKSVGPVCRKKLRPLFSDPEASVRSQAALAFEHIQSLDTEAQADLLVALLDSKPLPSPPALERVLRALENAADDA